MKARIGNDLYEVVLCPDMQSQEWTAERIHNAEKEGKVLLGVSDEEILLYDTLQDYVEAQRVKDELFGSQPFLKIQEDSNGRYTGNFDWNTILSELANSAIQIDVPAYVDTLLTSGNHSSTLYGLMDVMWTADAVNALQITTRTVSCLDDELFKDVSCLTEVMLLGEYKELPNKLFQGCKSLKKLQLAQTAEYVGEFCFNGCTALKHLDLPMLTTVEEYAFSQSGLEHLQLIGYDLTIQGSAFSDCKDLQDVAIITKSLSLAGTEIFKGCTSLKSVQLQGVIRTLAVGMFEGCDNLEYFRVPDGVTIVYGRCFYHSGIKHLSIPLGCSLRGCALKETKLETITFRKSDTADYTYEFAEEAFAKCENLQSICVPDGVKSLGKYCFSDCTSLRKVELPESLQEIGSYCFRNCTALEELNIPSKLSAKDLDFVFIRDVRAMLYPNLTITISKRANGYSFMKQCFEQGMFKALNEVE